MRSMTSIFVVAALTVGQPVLADDDYDEAALRALDQAYATACENGAGGKLITYRRCWL